MCEVRREQRARGRAFKELVRQLIASEPALLGSFGPAAPQPDVPPRYPLQRGEERRPRTDRAVVTVALFEDALAGRGRVASFELLLLSIGAPPGEACLQLELRPTDDAPDATSGWIGPASGRLMVDGIAFDFDAARGSHLDLRDGALFLEACLDAAWVDRDETHEELMATLTGVLVMRTPP